MDISWTRHLKTEEEKERFTKEVLSSKYILNHLSKLLDDVEFGLNRAEINPKVYDTPNWSHKQAHNNGFRHCLGVVKNLITVDQQKKD